ncbi:DUF2946 domain-containing protein [Oxalobacteraceae sp. CFBP 13730]|nr:DUF2946 domain-containing protein [Oxalobacteraceae sp. CFBP 8763]MBD8658457.1 DUF2946 domain-containing protein [Oxalobacteraceae sp. CFBP 13730]
MSAFAPSISKLSASSQDAAWAEICTAQGSKFVVLNSTAEKNIDALMVLDNHCGYCLLQHYSPFLSTPAYSFRMAEMPADASSIRSLGHFFVKRYAQKANLARAPPFFF